jgi:eukaryotic-like serine/threonine-protein kinase
MLPQRAVKFPPRFEVLRQVGRGGMGMVFEALDRERNLRVALKALTDVSPSRLYLFKQEFRALAGIVHPNLVTLYELIEADDEYFLSMEFIEGTTFLRYVRNAAMGAPISNASDSRATETFITSPEIQEVPTFTPAAGQCDGERLRAVTRQIAAGLHALHAAGKLHRDLKPSNVMIEPGGRAVILDFGLVADAEHERFGIVNQIDIAGTAEYMSPEQALGTVTPAADWYAVGTMLFQALTGRLPFEGAQSEILAARHVGEAPRARDLAPEIPEDLDRLCSRLLHRDPAQRPSLTEVLDLLGGSRPLGSTPPKRSKVFVGRREQIHQLNIAFDIICQGHAAVALLHGPSGTGKTTLAEWFLESISQQAGTLVLTGRCYEQETVPYKAVDSLVDRLGRFVSTLPEEQVEAVLPRDAASLASIFPVLERVPAFAEARRRRGVATDPIELRRRAFLALRDMLGRIGERSRLVIWLDDLQWTDQESAALLSEVMRAPDAPVLLLLSSYRAEVGPANPGLRILLEFLERQPLAKTDVDLQPLPVADATLLAEQILGDTSEETRRRASAIARDSGGLPFFIRELAQLGPEEESAGVSLESLIWQRQAQFEEAPRRLLQLVAIAGRPLSQADAFTAAGLISRSPAVLNLLTGAGLLSSTGPRETDSVETYHDRIRETIIARLDAGEKRNLHRQLAETLERSEQADPEMLAVHFQSCGQTEHAGSYYELAAERASRALAFDRAAGLYEQALSLAALTVPERSALEVKLAESLANAGRSAEASRRYFQAAEHSTAEERLSLEGVGAYHLCSAGCLDEGRERFRQLLRGVGVRAPEGNLRTVVSIVWRDLRLRRRGLDFKLRSEEQVAPGLLAKIDLLSYASSGIGTSDMVSGFDLLLGSVLLALQAGEPSRLIRALSFHAGFASMAGGSRAEHSEKELNLCQELSARTGGAPQARATITLFDAIRHYNLGLWSEALRRYSEAERILVEECHGLNWELSFARTGKLWTLMSAGGSVRLQEEAPRILEDAVQRGDFVTATNVATHPLPYAFILSGRPAEARETCEQWLNRWTHHGFGLQRALGVLATTYSWLYEDRPQNALDLMEGHWEQIARSGLLRLPSSSAFWWDTRARVLIVAAQASRGQQRRKLLRAAGRALRRLTRTGSPSSPAHAAHIRGALHALRGEWPRAVAEMESCARLFEQCDMKIYAASARRRLGEWTGGERGREWIADADRFMQSEKIPDPRAAARMHIAGVTAPSI